MLYETNTKNTVNLYYEIETENGKYYNFKKVDKFMLIDMVSGVKVNAYHVGLAFNDLQMQGHATFLGDSVYAVAILVNGETVYDNIRKNIDNLGALVTVYNTATGELEEKLYHFIGNAFTYVDMILARENENNTITVHFFDFNDSIFRQYGNACYGVDISSVVAQTEALYIVGNE